MKTKVLIVLGMIAALVIGFFIGRYQTNKTWNQYVEHFLVCWPAAHETDLTVRVLTNLQNGHQEDAINFLNVRLDELLAILNDHNKFPKDSILSDAIQNARAYRLKYPWTSSSPEENKMVKAALSSEK